jgi:uncharacterized protein (DUF2336 family)
MDFPVLIEELNDTVAHGTAKRRSEIVQRITDLFVGGSRNFSDDQIEVFDDVFVRIAASIEVSARSALAKRLAKEPRAPTAISRILACDDEIGVAGPMLEQSQRLDNNTLVTAARTKSQQHLLAISRRSSLDEAVTDVLVERGDKSVVLSTVGNPTARFSNGGYETLVSRSEGDDEIATSVGLRRDIPRQHLLRLVVRASDAVRRKLEADNPLTANMINDVVAEAATMVFDRVSAVSRNYAAACVQMKSLRIAGRLDENDVAAFAAANQFEETTAALSVLCGLPIEVVDRAMVHERPDAVLVMAKAVEMSVPTVQAILRMRAGTRGISPGELQQCLATFSRLKPATARQIIKFRDKHTPGSRFGRKAADAFCLQQ